LRTFWSAYSAWRIGEYHRMWTEQSDSYSYGNEVKFSQWLYTWTWCLAWPHFTAMNNRGYRFRNCRNAQLTYSVLTLLHFLHATRCNPWQCLSSMSCLVSVCLLQISLGYCHESWLLPTECIDFASLLLPV